MSENLHFEKKGLFGPAILDLNSERAKYYKKGCLFGCCGGNDEIKISEVRFFDIKDGIWQKLFGKQIMFGYREQIVMKGLASEEIEAIRNHLSQNGAKLGDGAQWVKKGIDFCCCTAEQLAVVPEGVMFKVKKWNKSESTFVEWEKMNVALFPPGVLFGRIPLPRLLGNYVVIMGELDIISEKRFPPEMIDEIRKGLHAKGIGESTGKVYRPFIFKGLKEHFQNCIILTDKGVVAKLSKKSITASEIPVNKGDKAGKTIFLPYEDIAKIGNAKIKGYLKIEGRITDLRTQSTATINIIMSKPCLCAWCGLKSAVNSRRKAR